MTLNSASSVAEVRLAGGSMEAVMDVEPGAIILLPIPPTMLGLEASVDLDGLVQIGEAASDFGPQRALIARASVSRPRANYNWRVSSDPPAPDWLWSPPEHSLNRAAPALQQHARELATGRSRPETVATVLQHVANVFRYGHGEGRFTDGTDAVPLVSCGLTRGTCVDIHTYAVAALRAADVQAAYVAGVFWPDGEGVARDMHCWLLADGEPPTVWDISHDLIASRSPRPDLLARPGIRFPLSVGRGQQFKGDGIDVEISHFAVPQRVRGEVVEAVPTTFTRPQ
ncbi:MAG: hypothetical protein C0471_13365 [Erythrobacter sp.]|nr:hypothetical protein [Sphingobium sp.]MBA4045392.1 hypothetical protein [Erythrobacter sp.]